VTQTPESAVHASIEKNSRIEGCGKFANAHESALTYRLSMKRSEEFEVAGPSRTDDEIPRPPLIQLRSKAKFERLVLGPGQSSPTNASQADRFEMPLQEPVSAPISAVEYAQQEQNQSGVCLSAWHLSAVLLTAFAG
jgi:hypothetical protein